MAQLWSILKFTTKSQWAISGQKRKKSHTSRLSSQCRNFHNVKALNISFLSFCKKKDNGNAIVIKKESTAKKVRRSVSSKLQHSLHCPCRVDQEFYAA